MKITAEQAKSAVTKFNESQICKNAQVDLDSFESLISKHSKLGNTGIIVDSYRKVSQNVIDKIRANGFSVIRESEVELDFFGAKKSGVTLYSYTIGW